MMSHAMLEPATSAAPTPAEPVTVPRFFTRLPRAVWLVALLAAALHMLPFLHALSTTPPDWTVTGILTGSPDYMQYRVWMRQSLDEGPIVSNHFTTEPNRPYLPVPFYWAIGQVAHALNASPEWVFVWTGALFAFVLTLLIFACTRYFLRGAVAIWTAFFAILLGGGVGGYILYLRRSPWAWEITPIKMLLIEPFRQNTELIDGLRGDYVISTLFDTHFLVIWVVCVSALMMLYATIRAFSPGRLTLTALLFAAATVLHVYEGVTLLMIVAAIALLCWIKRLHARDAIVAAVTCTAAVFAVFLWIVLLVRAGGVPVPPWRGVPVHPTLLFLAFPLAWVILVGGLASYWRAADLEHCFLLGWLLGCSALTLSAPFYPWPNRGVLSMQIPLTIIAAAIWFSKPRQHVWRMAVIAVLLMGSSPVMRLLERWQSSQFTRTEPHKFLGPGQRAVLDALQTRAGDHDVLVAGFKDRLWLAPEYRGRHYAGHFFLTVDYDRKQAEVDQFYRSTPDVQLGFLRKHRIRFLYVDRKQGPERFNSVPNLVPLRITPAGTLFEFSPSS